MALQVKPVMADFEHPLEMLAACHDRIRLQCETLGRLAAHLPLHGCDAEAQQGASNVMRYFDSAGRHHREDEEQDLFPSMILAAEGEGARRTTLLISQLEQEHRKIEAIWLRLRDTLEDIAHGEAKMLDAIEVSRFCALYRAHMMLEEANLFPLAEMMLNAEQLAHLGRRMAQRRGVRI